MATRGMNNILEKFANIIFISIPVLASEFLFAITLRTQIINNPDHLFLISLITLITLTTLITPITIDN